jgi:putative transposase
VQCFGLALVPDDGGSSVLCLVARTQSERDQNELMGRVKQFWLQSGVAYGYRKVAYDLRDLGEFCGKHRVYRLVNQEGLRAQVGYRRRAGHYGRPAVVVDNGLEQNFDVEAPKQV